MPDSLDTDMSLSLCGTSVNKAYLIAYSNAGTEVVGRNKVSHAIFQCFQSVTASGFVFNQSSV